MALSSDAHIATSIGHVEKCFDLLLEANFPEELIVNLTLERFQGYIEERAARLAAQEGAKV